VRDRQRSRALATAVRARNRYCYVNARRALTRVPSLIYVEGYVVATDDWTPRRHAWVETRERVILGPTPAWLRRGAAYFAVRRWVDERPPTCEARFCKDRVVHLHGIVDDLLFCSDSPGARQAYDAALEYGRRRGIRRP